MSIPIYQVDSFSGHCFQGNPAAVCVLDQPTHDAAWMQALAGEMNLSETAFIEPFQDDAGCFPLRWFTPLAEVDLCGHATLAAAHIMWTTERVAVTTPIRFITRSGVLEVHREAEQMTHKAYEVFKRLAGTPDHAKRCIARTLAELAR